MATRVLMIDDSLPLHRIVQARLAGDDVELHSAADGATGLAVAGHLRPALVLLDLDLPDVDGFEVCRRLKADRATADIPILFLTAAGGPDRRRAGLDLGAVGYVTKPFRADELSAQVRASIAAGGRSAGAAGVDPVTGLWTWPRVEAHLAAWTAQHGTVSCLVADVDGLRLVNARFGAAAGDEVLRAVAAAVRRQCGPDAACGAAGGRFVAAVAGDRRAGRAVAERARDAVGGGVVTGPWGGVGVTCGFGVADTVVAPAAQVVARARAALAHAKRAGPGRVSVARVARRPRAAA